MSRFRTSITTAVATASLLGLVATGYAQGPWVAPPDAKNAKNPIAGKDVAAGKKSAETNCASCHGPSGHGDGPAAAALNPKPANWTSDAVQKQTDGEIFWKITNGRGAMPPWKHLPENERWQLVNYIRTLKGK